MKSPKANAMKIHYTGLIKAVIPSILAFMLMDALVELVAGALFGISFISYFEQRLQCRYGIVFYSINLLLFSCEMIFVLFFYALIRPLFKSMRKPASIATIFFTGFAALFMAQLVNLGVYPLKPALLFSASTLVGFPAAVFVGAFVYDRCLAKPDL